MCVCVCLLLLFCFVSNRNRDIQKQTNRFECVGCLFKIVPINWMLQVVIFELRGIYELFLECAL